MTDEIWDHQLQAWVWTSVAEFKRQLQADNKDILQSVAEQLKALREILEREMK
jgi:hypothetical protein